MLLSPLRVKARRKQASGSREGLDDEDPVMGTVAWVSDAGVLSCSWGVCWACPFRVQMGLPAFPHPLLCPGLLEERLGVDLPSVLHLHLPEPVALWSPLVPSLLIGLF